MASLYRFTAIVFLLLCFLQHPRCATSQSNFLFSDDVAGFTREIQLAQKYGIDGFALNTGVWDDIVQTRADNLYTAAASLNFKLFFSADVPGSLTIDNLKTMLTRYAGYSSQLKYDGKQFLSTFSGRTVSISPYTDPLSTWRDGVLTPAGGNIFFVPYFETSGQQNDITSVINEFESILSGLLAWDTSAWPYLNGSGLLAWDFSARPYYNGDYNTPSDALDKAYLAACGAAGKVYMPSVSPWFFRTDTVIRGNYAGDGLWRTRWEQLIALQPPLVEVITWNDWAERTYVVSVSADNPRPPGAAENNDLVYPHLPYLDLAGRYYIPWYKTGNQPSIDSASKEALYIFYYAQSKSGSSVQNVHVLVDNVYVTVLLFQAADVTLTSGSQTTTFTNVQAGVQSVSMAFSPGQQSAKVVRNGAVVLSVTGDLSISSSNSQNDFNVYSKFASAS